MNFKSVVTVDGKFSRCTRFLKNKNKKNTSVNGISQISYKTVQKTRNINKQKKFRCIDHFDVQALLNKIFMWYLRN
jgi:hypothetical protein